MSEPSDNGTPPEVRFLKRLVTTLTVVMIAGLVTIVTLLVIRLGSPPAPLPTLPANIALPEGARAAAVTLARDWVVVVTEAGEILLYDRAAGGAPAQRLTPD
ncbi:DUF6476 family protein [Pararhodobacter sp. SW119]|uniref:DUF6476 family protein n=1 Tax=Pararhodobacter sp. SW119 TaxID=2780075 RepID=UPI001AE0B22C|nr:DUF6476 family protein [Pararhodobacter sp. SW119]